MAMSKYLVLGAVALAMALAGAPAEAQQRSPAFGPRMTVPSQGNFSWERGRGFKRGHGFPAFIVVEREVPVVVEREVVVREVPAAAPVPPPPPRKAYAVGASYASLPGGCMKMIEGGGSYYYWGGGEWYRPSGRRYLAIAKP